MREATRAKVGMGVGDEGRSPAASGMLRRGSMRSISDALDSNSSTSGSHGDGGSSSGRSIDMLLKAMRPSSKNVFALAASRQGKLSRNVAERSAEGGWGGGGICKGGGGAFRDILLSRMKRSIADSSPGTFPLGEHGPQSSRSSSAAGSYIKYRTSEGNSNGGGGSSSSSRFQRPRTAGPTMQELILPANSNVKGRISHAARANKCLALLGGKGSSGRDDKLRQSAVEDGGARLKDAMKKVRGVRKLSILSVPREVELDAGVRKRMQGMDVFERRKLGKHAGDGDGKGADVESISSLIACCSTPVLSTLGDEQRGRLAREARLCKAPDGSIVLGFDDTWTCALIVKEGTLEVCHGGELSKICSIGPGDAMGVAACASKDACQVVAIARGHVDYVELDRHSLVANVMACPSAREALAQVCPAVFATRLAYHDRFLVTPFTAPPMPLLPIFKLARKGIKESVSRRADECSRLKSLARECEARGDFDMAIYHHEGRIKTAEEMGDGDGTLNVQAFHDLAVVWEAKRCFAQASECYCSIWEAAGGETVHGGLIGGGEWGLIAAAGVAKCSIETGEWREAETWARLCITGAKQIGDTALQAYFQCVIARAMESQGRLEEAVEMRRVHLSFVREELGQGRAKHQGGSIQDYCECYALSLLGSSCEKLGRSLASRRRATARHDFVSSPDDHGNGLDLVGPRLKEGGGRAWNEGSEVVVLGIDQAWNGSCLVEQSSDGHLGVMPSYFLKITPGGVEALDDAIACHARHEAIAGRQGHAGDLLRACAISLRGYALQTKLRAEIGCEKGAGSEILFRTPSGSEELTTTMMAMNCHGEVFQLARDMYERELQELSREDMHLSQDQMVAPQESIRVVWDLIDKARPRIDEPRAILIS